MMAEQKEFDTALANLKSLKEKLNSYLINLDNRNMVLCSNDENKTIAETVELYCQRLLDTIASKDPRFKSTFLVSGSFYDDCKVGKLDEFDYMARIDSLSNPGTFRTHSSDSFGFVRLEVVEKTTCQIWEEFVEILEEEAEQNQKEEEKEQLQQKQEVVRKEKQQKTYFLANEFQRKFEELLSEALNEAPIPNNWIRHPIAIRHGPCSMLEFIVRGNEEKEEEAKGGYMSVDIAPAIKFPTDDFKFPFENYIENEDNSVGFLSKFLFVDAKEVLLIPFHFNETRKNEPTGTWQWLYSDKFRISFSILEKYILASYCPLSVEKRLFRVLKILKNEYLQDHPGRFCHLKFDDDKPPSTFLSNVSVEDATTHKQLVPHDIELPSNVSFDVHPDHIGDPNLVSTYALKSLFFYFLMYQTNNEGWKDTDLADIVTECIEALYVVYADDGEEMKNFFLDGATKKPPNKLKQQKILLSLIDLVKGHDDSVVLRFIKSPPKIDSISCSSGIDSIPERNEDSSIPVHWCRSVVKKEEKEQNNITIDLSATTSPTDCARYKTRLLLKERCEEWRPTWKKLCKCLQNGELENCNAYYKEHREIVIYHYGSQQAQIGQWIWSNVAVKYSKLTSLVLPTTG